MYEDDLLNLVVEEIIKDPLTKPFGSLLDVNVDVGVPLRNGAPSDK